MVRVARGGETREIKRLESGVLDEHFADRKKLLERQWRSCNEHCLILTGEKVSKLLSKKISNHPKKLRWVVQDEFSMHKYCETRGKGAMQELDLIN